jgi:FlaA1/EpsC-like NDP-sugar epimerase
MVGEMDADMVIGYFRGKSILITGSTGFLGKGMYVFLHGYSFRMCTVF